MARAKEILIKPISALAARSVIKRYHYSKKVVSNSQLNFGVFLNEALLGALQFGPSMDKRKLIGLVEGTKWNNFIELNRMAFSDRLPKNSESRAISICMKIIKKKYPHIDWVVSFSDATQCGDGTIYRASGFYLTKISPNKTIYEFPSGDKIAGMTIEANWNLPIMKRQCDFLGVTFKMRTRTQWAALGAKPVPGYQLRYIYFLNKKSIERLSVPALDFSEIDRVGAGMYKGLKRAKKADSSDQLERGGAVPTSTLHLNRGNKQCQEESQCQPN